MLTFKQILNLIERKEFSASIDDFFPLSQYTELFGYRDKHTFARSVKAKGYELQIRHSIVEQRKGKDYYISPAAFFELLYTHFQKDEEFLQTLIDLYYVRYKKNIYKFKKTSHSARREVFYELIYAKGIFYNYSLNSLSFAQNVGICPYECYKYCVQHFHKKWGCASIDYDTKIPTFYFDSRKHSERMQFLSLINHTLNVMNISPLEYCKITAYKIAVIELLNKQKEIDDQFTETLRKELKENEDNLKEIYREACKLYHPDRNKSPEAEDIMKQINTFYERKDFCAIKFLIDESRKTV